jgi:hypothetical protein
MSFSLSNIPVELQYHIFLDLSYEDIINYCSIHPEAKRICQSYLFWNLKARHDYDISIDLINENTPALKYKILHLIFLSENPLQSISFN